MFFGNIPDADGYMVACSRTLTFGLADMDHSAWDGCKPFIDVVFVGRFNDRFSVATYKGE